MSLPAGYHNVEFVYRHGSGTRDCTFGLGIKDNATVPDPATVAQGIYDVWKTSGNPGQLSNVSNEWLFLGISDTWESETGPIRYEYRVVEVGTASISPLPINCAVLVNKNTAAGGRRNRGRLFLPPTFPTEADVNGLGVIQNSDVVAQQAKWTAFYNGLIAADFQPVLLHQTGSPLPTNITGFSFQSLLATQRRRMRR